eukprot:3385371-Prymnesium_polylepis.1
MQPLSPDPDEPGADLAEKAAVVRVGGIGLRRTEKAAWPCSIKPLTDYECAGAARARARGAVAVGGALEHLYM